MTSFALVVPLYNEQARFAEFAPRLAAFIGAASGSSELIFVDDGSTDETAEFVEKFMEGCRSPRIRLVRAPHRGKGAAITAGIGTSTADVIGFADIDLSTPLEDIAHIHATAERGHLLAIGSRALTTSRLVRRQPRFREILGRSYNRFVQLLLTPGIVDTQCGAKVAARDVWERILPLCRECGFAWDTEIIAVARRLRIPVREVPVNWSHDDRSRVHVVRDGLKMVLSGLRMWSNLRKVPPESLAPPGGVFDDENIELLAESDSDHWWFRSKAAFVAWALRRWPPRRGEWLVDLGAGAGGVSVLLGWREDRIVAIDGSEALVRFSRHRHGLLSVVGDIDALPLRPGSAGVVSLLDVIEHLPDPVEALRSARSLITAGGRLVVTVPAHPRLWSRADELLGHTQRYTRRSLLAQLEEAGFRPLLLTHVFSWLVPPAWLMRRLAKTGRAQTGLGEGVARLSPLALLLTRLERALLRVMRLPVGTSILCVAEPTPGS